MVDPTAVEQFTSITGADAATATFFLSAAGGDTDAAVTTFFETGGVMPAGATLPTTTARPAPTRPPPSNSNPPAQPARQRRPAASGIATLSSLREAPEDDERNSYYAGGEKSGQVIQDPHKRKTQPDASASASNSRNNPSTEGEAPENPNLADAIFERARERGPRTDEDREAFDGPQTFTGAGYRLGDTNRPPSAGPDVLVRRNITRNLTFYANGFTVDDGPLRGFDDPDNEAFLADVNRGIVPREMEEPGVGDVSITLIDKKGEDYVAPKKRIVPFSGGGQRLSDGPSSAAPAAPASGVNAENASAAVSVDESRPVASIQVRLSDGTRLVARMNEDNTVRDLRSFVAASRPGIASFTLATSYPRKILDDDDKTIKEAQLKGAVVLQTLK